MAFNEMRYHKNTFPRKAFQRNAFHEMLSTTFRRSTIGKNQVILGYSGAYCMATATLYLRGIADEQ